MPEATPDRKPDPALPERGATPEETNEETHAGTAPGAGTTSSGTTSSGAATSGAVSSRDGVRGVEALPRDRAGAGGGARAGAGASAGREATTRNERAAGAGTAVPGRETAVGTDAAVPGRETAVGTGTAVPGGEPGAESGAVAPGGGTVAGPDAVTGGATGAVAGAGSGSGAPGVTGPSTVTPLLPREECDKFGTRLREAVTGFIDGPRDAVEEADRVVGELTSRFTEALTQRRRTLLASWQTGDKDKATAVADTEQLRLALRDYRELADRLTHL